MTPKEQALAIWRYGTQPALAVAVWVLVFLLCVFSAKDLKEFVESVGDLGPVIVAWLVYQLGRQQHEAANRRDTRELRLQLFEKRSSIYDRYVKEILAIINKGTATYVDVGTIGDIVREAEYVFEEAAMVPMRVLQHETMSLARAESRLRNPRVRPEVEREANDKKDLALERIVELLGEGEKPIRDAIRVAS